MDINNEIKSINECVATIEGGKNLNESESTVLQDIKSALKGLQNAEGSLYHAVDDSSQMDFNKELESIYKDVKKAYEALVKLGKKNKIT